MQSTPSLNEAKTLYHGTSSVNLGCIKTLGLVPNHAKGGDAWAKEHHMSLAVFSKLREPSVFVADDVAQAKKFAWLAVEEVGGDPVVVTLRVPEQVFATFSVDELYESDEAAKPHAWRAHSIEPTYVADVQHVRGDGANFKQTLALEALLDSLL